MNACLKTAALAAACLILASAPFAAGAQEQQPFRSLSPEGEAIFKERVKAYPSFDEGKVKAEAAERFKPLKKGDLISITVHGRSYSGAFLGIEGRSIIIDEKKIPVIDVPEDTISKFDEAKAKERQERFLRNARESYELERIRYEEKQRTELFRSYPALDERKLAEVFSPIKDQALKLSLMNNAAALYRDSLPQAKSPDAILAAAIAAMLASHPQLELVAGKAYVKDERAAELAKAAELEKEKAKRAAERALLPKAASPDFEPDGGPFDISIPVKISSATPEAVIHFTLDGSTPNAASPVYKEPVKLKQPATVRAIALHPNFNDSEATATAAWSGLGLYASYFDRLGFSGATITRIDPEIDFDWSKKSPAPSIPADLFSVIWAGSLTPPESGDYTLHISADNGVRLWLEDKLLVEGWSDGAPADYAAAVKLVEGRRYDLKVAYCECDATPRIRLDWSSTTMRRRPVPSSCLSAKGRYVEEMLKWNEKQGGAYMSRPSLQNPGAAATGSPAFKNMPERRKDKFTP